MFFTTKRISGAFAAVAASCFYYGYCNHDDKKKAFVNNAAAVSSNSNSNSSNSKKSGSNEEEDAAAKAAAFSAGEFKSFKLRENVKVSPNTHMLRFDLPREEQLSGMYTASCVVVKNGDVVRPYTPISDHYAAGYFDLLVKSYPDGVMSKHLTSLKAGDSVLLKGPIKKLEYVPNQRKTIHMVAGGTGITPMVQVIRTVLANPKDETHLNLIFANVTPNDILLKEFLDVLQVKYKERFTITYVLEKDLPPDWKGEEGRVNEAMLKKYLDPKPSKDTLVLVCGPPGMLDAVAGPKNKDFTQGDVKGFLGALGYDNSNVFKF